MDNEFTKLQNDIINKRIEAENDLKKLERYTFDLETKYFEATQQTG